jgi:hypothetical protein
MSDKDIQAGDDLDLLLNREVLLLCGGPGDGKSFSVAMLVLDCLEVGQGVVIIDRDRGMSKAIKEVFISGANAPAAARLEELGAMGRKPENLDYFLADTWDKLPNGVNHAFEVLSEGGWLVFEMVGRMWDFAQTAYAERIYGSLTEHQLILRADAQAELAKLGLDPRSADKKQRSDATKVLQQKTGFGGMEGRTDWPFIKRMHNEDVFDKAMLQGRFNILSTTSMTPLEEREAGKWPLFSVLGRRPEGEKHQTHRHDTLAICYQKNREYLWKTDLGGGKFKDRGGRPKAKDVPFTDIGFVASYLGFMESPPAPEDTDDDA